MTDGVFTPNYTRYKTKKALKEAVAAEHTPILEVTSMFLGPEEPTSIPFDALVEGKTYTIVGPDPYRARNWYANVVRHGSRIKVN
jgi:hypothetical protein